jgi:hypothetical protein
MEITVCILYIILLLFNRNIHPYVKWMRGSGGAGVCLLFRSTHPPRIGGMGDGGWDGMG